MTPRSKLISGAFTAWQVLQSPPTNNQGFTNNFAGSRWRSLELGAVDRGMEFECAEGDNMSVCRKRAGVGLNWTHNTHGEPESIGDVEGRWWRNQMESLWKQPRLALRFVSGAANSHLVLILLSEPSSAARWSWAHNGVIIPALPIFQKAAGWGCLRCVLYLAIMLLSGLESLID